MTDRIVARSWAEYDRLLEMFEAGDGPEPEAPHAPDPGSELPVSGSQTPRSEGVRRNDVEHRKGVGPRNDVERSALSVSTERRRRLERRKLIGEIERDGRRTTASILAYVASKRTSDGLRVMVCEFCGDTFTAKRSDARFCTGCRKNDRGPRRGDGDLDG